MVELIVVIAIIAILATVLFGTFSGSMESARTALCLTNMKNLASAVQLVANATTDGSLRYPQAGSTEYFNVVNDNEIYNEYKGWISWASQNAYPSSASKANSGWIITMYDQNKERRLYSLTNGAIWKATGCNHSIYLCPSHAKAMQKYDPNYSYVMNAAFKWSPNPGQDLDVGNGDEGCDLSDYPADKVLLFSEIQFVTDAKVGLTATDPSTSGITCDAVLQYQGCEDEGSYNECIGFNHKSGKSYCANIVYMDGHVDKLVMPKAGLSQSDWQNLTKWLCDPKDPDTGEIRDVGYNPSTGRYEQIQ